MSRYSEHLSFGISILFLNGSQVDTRASTEPWIFLAASGHLLIKTHGCWTSAVAAVFRKKILFLIDVSCRIFEGEWHGSTVSMSTSS